MGVVKTAGSLQKLANSSARLVRPCVRERQTDNLQRTTIKSRERNSRMNTALETSTEKAKPRPWMKLAILAVVVGLAAVAYTQFGDALSLESLAQKESQLRDFQAQHPVLVFGIAFLIYVAITGLSLPGAAAMTLLSGWYFGIVQGILLVSFASTTGATLAFLLSRFLFRDAIQQKFGERLSTLR